MRRAHHRALQALRTRVERSLRATEAWVPDNSRHPLRLGEVVLRLYGDWGLAAAAALSDLPLGALGSSAEQVVGEDVMEVLESWAFLRHTPAVHEQVRTGVLRDALPSVKDPRGAFLLVHHLLGELDPEGTLLAFTKAFPTSPGECDLGLPNLQGVSPEFVRGVAAPVAEYCGLWLERNVLENLAVIQTDAKRFRGVVQQCIAAVESGGACDRAVGAVREALELAAAPDQAPRWEWRHVASLAKQRGAALDLAHSGYVTVPCATADLAYQLLSRLHQAAAVRPNPRRLVDFLGAPTNSGYRALHTIVSHAGLGGSIAVRFLVCHGSEDYSAILRRAMKGGPQREIFDYITVSTPNGDAHHLPQGSTVLNFAASVHTDFLSIVTAARVNGVHTLEVLAPLRHGDRVELLLGDTPSFPPQGWESLVPKETVWALRKGLRASFTAHLRSLGRRWLLENIRRRWRSTRLPTTEGFADEILNPVLDDVNARIFGNSRRAAERWHSSKWLKQLGLVALREQGQMVPFRLSLDDAKIKLLLSAIDGRVQWLLEKDANAADELPDIPIDLIKGIDSRRGCLACMPTETDELVACRDGRVLVFHRAGAPCTRDDAFPLARGRRLSSGYGFFVVAGPNRVGIAQEVLQVMKDHQVDVVEVVGRHAGGSWGVVRVEAELAGLPVHRIVKRLEKLPGVVRVRGPGQPPLPILEASLPVRQVRSWSLAELEPYFVGPAVIDDRYFYGRRPELARLRELLDIEQLPGTRSGVAAWIAGPLRCGKTSLALRFLRDVAGSGRVQRGDVLGVYYKVGYPPRKDSPATGPRAQPRAEPWELVEAALSALLQEEAARFATYRGVKPPEDQHGDLLATLQAVGRALRIPIVIVLDELARLLGPATDGSASGRSQVERFAGFLSALGNMPRCLVCLVGPSLGPSLRSPFLDDALRGVLRVDVGPLSVEDTQELLEARRLRWLHSITAQKRLVKDVHWVTGGNPFWIAHIGHGMWKRKRNENLTVMQYDKSSLEAVRTELAQNEQLFQGRVLPEGCDRRSKEAETIWLVLSAVCRLSGRGDVWVPRSRIVNSKLARHRGGEHGGEVEDVLDDLVERGALATGGEDGNSIRPIAPLIVDYVAARNPFAAPHRRRLATKRSEVAEQR